MLNNNDGLVKFVLSVLLFPTFFQEAFLLFAWGSADPFWMMMSKRFFLLLPVAAVILGCWLSVACSLTVIIRPNRQAYVKNIFITWWDLGRSIAAFWGGFVKFAFRLAVALVGFVRVAAIGLWSLVQEFVLMPFRLLANAGRGVATSPIPWIAVALTLFWCLIEATIFTYVTTPLVVDTFSNITGDNLTEGMVRIPLFIFLLFVVLGSYAVLSTLVESLSKKSISSILGIGVIEVVVLFVEVVFLYREFVDALVPWFAQYSNDFELGIFWTLAISTFVWFGIRSLSWFLFAAHGTPTIMTVIQGKGLTLAETPAAPRVRHESVSADFMARVRADMAWVEQTGEELLAALILPPLQVVGAAINFCMLLVTGEHLFELPFETLADLRTSPAVAEVQAADPLPKAPPAAVPVLVSESPSYSPGLGDLQNVETH